MYSQSIQKQLFQIKKKKQKMKGIGKSVVVLKYLQHVFYSFDTCTLPAPAPAQPSADWWQLMNMNAGRQVSSERSLTDWALHADEIIQECTISVLQTQRLYENMLKISLEARTT